VTKPFKPYIGQLGTAKQLIRHRNIMLGLPITKLSTAFAPYGYEDDPDREGWYRPVQKELEALYWARQFKQRSTYRQLAEWLTKETGRSITRDSFRVICRYRPPLAALLLPLHDRLSIATCANEEKAIELDIRNARWNTRKSIEARSRYLKARSEVVKRKEEARRAERSKQS
jgi:hypothetical protein